MKKTLLLTAIVSVSAFAEIIETGPDASGSPTQIQKTIDAEREKARPEEVAAEAEAKAKLEKAKLEAQIPKYWNDYFDGSLFIEGYKGGYQGQGTETSYGLVELSLNKGDWFGFGSVKQENHEGQAWAPVASTNIGRIGKRMHFGKFNFTPKIEVESGQESGYRTSGANEPNDNYYRINPDWSYPLDMINKDLYYFGAAKYEYHDVDKNNEDYAWQHKTESFGNHEHGLGLNNVFGVNFRVSLLREKALKKNNSMDHSTIITHADRHIAIFPGKLADIGVDVSATREWKLDQKSIENKNNATKDEVVVTAIHFFRFNPKFFAISFNKYFDDQTQYASPYDRFVEAKIGVGYKIFADSEFKTEIGRKWFAHDDGNRNGEINNYDTIQFSIRRNF